MKKSIYLLLILILSYCTAIPGIDTIDGKSAKKKLIDAASAIDRIGYTLIGSPVSAAFAKALNTMLVPVFISINDGKYYDKASVEDCVSKVNSIQGLILSGAVTIPFCDVKEAAFIDIGPLDLPEGKNAKVNKDLAMLLTIVGLTTPVPTSTGTGAGSGTGFGTGTGSGTGVGTGTGSGSGTGTGTGTGTTTPTITSFSPTSGIVGTTVTISGTNFSSTTANNSVQFNGTTATVTSASSNSLTVTVPSAATTGAITVTVLGQTTVTSATGFTISSPTALTLGATFLSGTLTSTNSKQYYTFSATSGKFYSVYWDDSFQGSGTYTVDIVVRVLKADGVSIYKTTTDSGYYLNSPASSPFQATETGTVYVEVVGYSSGSTGTYGVRVAESASIAILTQTTTNNLFSIACPGSSITTCIAVGSTGTIVKTTDGGTNWATLTSGTVNNLSSISCPTSAICYVTGTSGVILKSTDTGTTWTALTSGVATNLVGISCPDATTCYAVGSSGVIRKTIDGSTWTAVTSNTTNALNSIHCSSTNNCVAVGSSGTITKTADGATFSLQTSNTTSSFNGVFAADLTNYIATSAVSSFSSSNHRFTTDGGTTWSNYYMASANSLGVITCNAGSITNCTAVGSSGTILRTNSGTNAWSINYSTATQTLWGVACPSSTTCFIVGESGRTLKLTQ